MTLNELRAALGTEVLVVEGGRESGYTKYHAMLDNVIANAIYSVGKTESNIDAIVTITGETRRTVQVRDNRIFPVAQEAQVDAKIARLNASITAINGEGV